MVYNEIIKRLRYAMNFSDFKLMDIFALGGEKLDRDTVCGICAKEEDDNFIACSSDKLEAFLNGLIVLKRGSLDSRPTAIAGEKLPLNNNQILRKIRIALNYKDVDMLEIIHLGGLKFSKNQLSALFRAKHNHHYQECGDQLLRKFLQGLITKYRKGGEDKKPPKRKLPSDIIDF